MAGLVVRSGVSLRARARGTFCPRSGDFPLGANKELVLRVLPRKQAFSTNLVLMVAFEPFIARGGNLFYG